MINVWQDMHVLMLSIRWSLNSVGFGDLQGCMEGKTQIAHHVVVVMVHQGMSAQMAERRPSLTRADFVLMAVSIVTLSVAIWIWFVAMPIAREIVFLVTTLALVIALVLVVNVAILLVIQLQKRVTHLEEAISEKGNQEGDADYRVIVVTLTNTERRIINRLEENGGTMAQDDLRRATGLSKSTLSVTLGALERKSLIRREQSGRTKIVILEHSISR